MLTDDFRALGSKRTIWRVPGAVPQLSSTSTRATSAQHKRRPRHDGVNKCRCAFQAGGSIFLVFYGIRRSVATRRTHSGSACDLFFDHFTATILRGGRCRFDRKGSDTSSLITLPPQFSILFSGRVCPVSNGSSSGPLRGSISWRSTSHRHSFDGRIELMVDCPISFGLWLYSSTVFTEKYRSIEIPHVGFDST